jgi:hypothetical protein
MIVGISTVYRKSGLLYQKWRENAGRPGDILVIKQPSVIFNPTLDQAAIDADIALDPPRGSAEWLSEWRSDIADFVDRAVVEACVAAGRHELPPLSGASYYGFADPSGGSADSYTVAVAHRDEKSGLIVLDAVREIRPPFSPEVATSEHAGLLKSYRIQVVTGDRYAGEWPADQFTKHGIRYEPSELSKSEIYIESLPMLNAHRAELLDNPRLISQLCALERRTVRGSGRDVVDHSSGRHDDVCNAAMGALLLAGTETTLNIDDAVIEAFRGWGRGYEQRMRLA